MADGETWVNIDDLALWKRNYNSADIGAIITSVRKFGFNNALRVWNGTVMAGNHSLMALRQLVASNDWTPAGGSLRVNGSNGIEIQIVDVSHLPELDAEAFAVADNHIASLADSDNEALAALLQELANEDAALLESTGYDGDDLDDLLRDIDPANYVEFREYDESIADEVEFHECPECGHRFPK